MDLHAKASAARRRSALVLPGVVLGLVVGAGLVPQSNAVATDGAHGVRPDSPGRSELVTYGRFAPPEPLRRQPAHIQELVWSAEMIVNENKGDFLGSFVTESGRVKVVPGNSAGRAKAASVWGRRSDVEVGDSKWTIDSVAEAGQRMGSAVPSLLAEGAIVSWGADPEVGGMKLTLRRDATVEEKSAIEAFASDESLPVRVEVFEGAPMIQALDDRLVDPSPYAGGARIGMATGSGSAARVKSLCTSGFGFLRGTSELILTAGHCFPRDSSDDFLWVLDQAGDKKQYGGQKISSSWDNGTGSVAMGNDNGRHGDLSIVNVSGAGRDAGDQIWWGPADTGDKIPVKVRHAPADGDAVCFSGWVSGADCGLSVVDTNQSVAMYDSHGTFLGTNQNVDLSYSEHGYDCPQPGDSGAPVILNHDGAETFADAKGVVSGAGTSGSDCVMVTTGIEEAVQAWGGDLHYG